MSPRIWVTSLTDYTAGELHGRWIDANQEPEDILAEVEEMLKESPTAREHGCVAEEWRIDDYDEFYDIRLSEWESFERVSAIAKLLEEHPPALVSYFLGNGYELKEIPDAIDNQLIHESDEWSEVRAVAEWHWEQLESRDDIPKDIKDTYLWGIAELMAHSDINGGVVHTIQVSGPEGRKYFVLSN